MKTAELQAAARATRLRLLRMHFEAGCGHVGGGLSAIDLLTCIYRAELRNPAAPDGDRFILSKGHAASALYATLGEAGLLSEEELRTYYQEGTLLPAHPAPQAFSLIPAATGSLGHGLPIAAGMALARKRFRPSPSRVFCLISDGECNEGSTWEAALFAAHHRLDNLTVLIDANGLQGFGACKDVLGTEPLEAKWRAFGFTTVEFDGHDIEAIRKALAAPAAGAPRALIARTVKGKGVSFMEGRFEWHYLPMNEAQYRQAQAEVNGGAG